MSTPRSIISCAVAAGVMLLGAGCGGSDDADNAEGPTASSPTDSATSDPTPTASTPSESTPTEEPAPEPLFDGNFAVIKTATRVPKRGFDTKVGDTTRRVWVVKAACGEGRCGGRLSSFNPDNKGSLLNSRFVWSHGVLTFAFKQSDISCGEGFGEFKVVSAYRMKPTKVDDDGAILRLQGRSKETYSREGNDSRCFEGVLRNDVAAKKS